MMVHNNCRLWWVMKWKIIVLYQMDCIVLYYAKNILIYWFIDLLIIYNTCKLCMMVKDMGMWIKNKIIHIFTIFREGELAWRGIVPPYRVQQGYKPRHCCCSPHSFSSLFFSFLLFFALWPARFTRFTREKS